MKPDPSIFDQADADADEGALREGEADADAGRVVSNERVLAWLKSWGTLDELLPPKP